MKLIKYIVLTFCFSIIAACGSINAGHFNSESHFSYTNSNITPLGHVKSTLTRWSFLSLPVEGDDALTLVNEAIAQKPGADLMINYVLDTKITMLPLYIFKADMVVEGTAAKMEIGEQELQSMKYRAFKKSLK